ncbi:MAG: hypothetical protein J6I73_07465 [Treponema sp.]|nr:hypothetical protein [Treponema sp.]
MLSRNKLSLCLCVALFAIELTSCIGWNYYPYETIGASVTVCDKDGKVLKDIVCTLRNDDSSEILTSNKTEFNGTVSFSWKSGGGPYATAGVCPYAIDIIKELDAQKTGISKFYITINDKSADGYNAQYTTETQRCNADTYNSAAKVYLTSVP